MGKTVKTYKSLRTQSVDGHLRHFGDFIPEAATWPNLATYIRSHYVEETFVDSDDLDEQLAEQRANDIVVPAVVEGVVTGDLVVDGPLTTENLTVGVPETVAVTKVPLTPEEIDALVEQQHEEPVLVETPIEIANETNELVEEIDEDEAEEIEDEVATESEPAVKLKIAKKSTKKGKK